MTTPDPLAFPVRRLAPIPTFIPAWQPHLLSGPSGVGKTCFCAWWATRMRDGEPIFGKPTNKVPWIGLLTTDRDQDDTLQWYEIAGWPDIPVYSAVNDYGGFNYHKDLRNPEIALAKLIKILDFLQVPPNGVLIADPVSAWAGGDLNRYDRVMPAMGALSQYCLYRKLTIIGVAHTGKQHADPKANYGRPQDKILGSMALLGSSGTQMALEGPDQTGIPGTSRFSWMPHHAPAESYDLVRDPTTGLFVPVTDDPHAIVTTDEKVLALVALIPLEPTPTAEIVAAAETSLTISRKTVYRHLQQAASLGLIEKLAHGQYRRAPVN